MPNFANRLKRSRKVKGITQLQLAEAVQVHRASIQRWERGDDMPTATAVLRLADTLETSVRYLLGKVETPEKWLYLTQDERKLIDLYRALPENARHALSDSAKDLLAVQRKTTKT